MAEQAMTVSDMSFSMQSEDDSDAPDSQQSSVSMSPFEDGAFDRQILCNLEASHDGCLFYS